ncbi:hypothetical protein ACJRPK_11575 [Aquimarina sp. 2-A2]|uniref:hypothetical protein n=1 Tax=Aquimarina sp. 2-A2 TaxID=3382644 RepID=UPI00387EFC2C
MKKFIFKTTLFFITPIVAYVAIFYFLKFSFKNDIARYPVIVLGDSQTEFIRNENIYNLSIHGSPFFVLFKFSEQFIDQLKGKKIYIASNYHSLSKLYENRLANDSLLPGWRASMFEQVNTYNIVNHKYSKIRPSDLDYSFFDIKKIPKLFHRVYLNNKSENSMNNIIKDTLSISNAIHRHWNHESYLLKDSIQKTYLKKLITFLNENNCEVILLKMPLTSYYTENVPLEVKDQLSDLSNDHDVRVLDLNKELAISNKYKYFKDYGHLNKSGDSLIIDYFMKNEIHGLSQQQ